MPLYMDRHDVPGSTAREVADAHRSDLEIAGEYGVEFISYWFDPDIGAAFCFARAPSAERVETVHRASHGLIPAEIIAVSEGDVFRFLGRVRHPADHSEVTSPIRTILFTDLEGSTALLDTLGQAEFMDLLTEHDRLIRRSLVTWRGREVKHTGDGFLASFDDVADALRCSLGVSRAFDERSPQAPPLRVRIGMAAGEPVDHDDDLFGAAVNLANRICAAAQPGRPRVSDTGRDLGTDQGFVFGPGVEMELKGFARPSVVYELQAEPDGGVQPSVR
jgi:class 3 adenylate cyclase